MKTLHTMIYQSNKTDPKEVLEGRISNMVDDLMETKRLLNKAQRLLAKATKK
jgi:hypothetical protein